MFLIDANDVVRNHVEWRWPPSDGSKDQFFFLQFYWNFQKNLAKIWLLPPSWGWDAVPTINSGSAIAYEKNLLADITLNCFSPRMFPSLSFVQKFKTVRHWDHLRACGVLHLTEVRVCLSVRATYRGKIQKTCSSAVILFRDGVRYRYCKTRKIIATQCESFEKFLNLKFYHCLLNSRHTSE